MGRCGFLTWGWRVPFLLSAVLVGIGLTIRLSLTETPQFRKALAAQKLSRTPVAEVLRTSWRQVILAAGTFVAPNAMGYIVITYSLSYTTRILHLNRNAVIWAILAASVIWLIVAGWVAAMSDRWGRRRVLVVCLVALTIWSLVFFALLDTGSFPLMLLALVVLAALQGAANGPQAALFAELFETHVRYSGISLAYQAGSILGGGVAPFLATALYDIRLSSLPVTGYLVLISIVSLSCALAIRESGRHHQSLSSRTAGQPGLHTHE